MNPAAPLIHREKEIASGPRSVKYVSYCDNQRSALDTRSNSWNDVTCPHCLEKWEQVKIRFHDVQERSLAPLRQKDLLEMETFAATEYPEGTTDWHARRKAFIAGMVAQKERSK